MRLSISNIAWRPEEDLSVAALLAKHDVDAIDVAPGKYFKDFATTSSQDITDVRRWWRVRGIEIVGMQALLFGTQGLNLFGEPAVRERMLAYLAHVCRIAHGLDARFLVFGSPRNRDRSGLDDHQTADIAKDFFRRLGDIAADQDTVICLEPNPPLYGGNFMTDAAATAEVVRAVNHPAIRMQLDVGALSLNGESAAAVLARDADLVAHVHASEPELGVLGDHGTDHGPVASAIRKFCPNKIVTIEMREDADAPLASLERALVFAQRWYGGVQGS
jgi:D-psicose/D-tagatose/L-ribulose 3-epimerase